VSSTSKFVDRLLEDLTGPESGISDIQITYQDGTRESVGFNQEGELDGEIFSPSGGIMNAGGYSTVEAFLGDLGRALKTTEAQIKSGGGGVTPGDDAGDILDDEDTDRSPAANRGDDPANH
jgi:hypothetical protein